jgi:hypothetical protein
MSVWYSCSGNHLPKGTFDVEIRLCYGGNLDNNIITGYYNGRAWYNDEYCYTKIENPICWRYK